jgi:thiol-disulfide isomerase/thioredoxin
MRELVTQNVLLAARLAEQPAEAERLKPFVEREPPAVSYEMSAYWWDRARLSSLEGKKAEALTYYQKALHARLAPPPFFEGRQTPDYLTDEARSLWNQLGGSETDWTVWSKPSPEEIHQIQEVNDNVWEKPKKALPPFHLTDLSGKTWTLTSLAGRAVLVNVWATWCGPCQAELPHLQKLYEKVKDRADLQILTLNIDEDPGVVAPFVKENNYTFPVLPAYAFVYGIDLVGIPQNWIVDSKGEWRWTGGPDLTNREWESAILKKLESASSGKSR